MLEKKADPTSWTPPPADFPVCPFLPQSEAPLQSRAS